MTELTFLLLNIIGGINTLLLVTYLFIAGKIYERRQKTNGDKVFTGMLILSLAYIGERLWLVGFALIALWQNLAGLLLTAALASGVIVFLLHVLALVLIIMFTLQVTHDG